MLLATLYNPDDIKVEDKELSYIAGLFDGEVALTINRSGPNARSYTLNISWTNRNYDILKYLSTIFGGKISKVKKQPNHRFNEWQWNIYAGNAYRVLRKLYPLLRVKKETAGICIEFFEHFWQGKSKKPVSLERKAIGQYYVSRLKEHQSKPGRSKKPCIIHEKEKPTFSIVKIQEQNHTESKEPVDFIWSELDNAYIAGLLDVESSFIIYKLSNRPSYLFEVAYRKTDKNTLQYLAKIFGGKVRSAPMSSGNKKEVWIWKVTSAKAYTVIKTIYPLLRIKKRHAELCMEFFKLYWQGSSTKQVSPERQSIGAKYVALLKSYNPKSMKHKRKKECDTV